MESGLMVLSIYCAHMAPKWNSLLELRPKQRKDMSVEVYYDQFFNWKKKLDEVNYIGGEESYIDDFLFGLKMDLVVRVCGCKWKPHTLYGAFRRAEMEETMISLKELSRKNDADKVFEEMSHPKSVNSAASQGAEDVSDEDGNAASDASDPVDDKFYSNLPAESYSLQGGKSQVDVLEDSACNVIDEMVRPLQLKKEYYETDVDENVAQHGTCKVFAEMLKPVTTTPQSFFMGFVVPNKADENLVSEVGQPHSLKMRSLEAVRHLFDKMPERFSVKQKNGIDINKELVLSTIDLLKILGHEEAVSEVNSTVISSMAEAKEVTMFNVSLWVGEIMMFMFDPGGSSWHHKGCEVSTSIAMENHEFDVELWVGKILMFIFDPGGSSLFQNSCDSLSFTDDKQHFNKFFGIKAVFVLHHKYCRTKMLMPLLFEQSDRNAGLKSFPGKFYSNSMIEKVELSSLKAEIQLDGKVQQPFSFKPEVAKVVYKVFDEMLGINKALNLNGDCFDESAYDAELGLDTTVARNPVDDKMLEDTKLIDSEEIKGNDSAIKIVEAGNHFTKLLLPKSVGNDEGIGQNEGNHGNEIDGECAQVIKNYISNALLTHIYFQNNQTWIITKYGLISANLHSSRENLTYPAFVEFKHASFSTDVDAQFYFDPGGIYVTCFSRGALHPLISKAPGICVDGMKKIVPPLRHALSVMASGDKNCLVGSNYSYLFSNGVHTILVVRVDSGAHEDDFTKVDSKAMLEGVNFKLTTECILAYLAHSELVLSCLLRACLLTTK